MKFRTSVRYGLLTSAILLGVGLTIVVVRLSSRNLPPESTSVLPEQALKTQAETTNQARLAAVVPATEFAGVSPTNSPVSTNGQSLQVAVATNPPLQRHFSFDPVDMMKETLNLSDEQAKKLRPILKEQQDKMSALRRDNNLTRQDRRAQLKEMQDTADAKMKAILTPDQAQKWNEMRSAPQRLFAQPNATNTLQFLGSHQPPFRQPPRTPQPQPANAEIPVTVR